MTKPVKKVAEQPKKKVAPLLKKEPVKPAAKPKTIIWKDVTPIKTKKHDTSKSSAADSDERDNSAMSSMWVERLSRKRKRIHPPRQSPRLLRASGKRG
jgi:hypothetical protein